MWAEIGGAVAGSTVLTALVDRWFYRRKVSADAEVTLSDGYVDLVAELRAERVELRAERAELRQQLEQSQATNNALMVEVIGLRAEVHSLKEELARVRPTN